MTLFDPKSVTRSPFEVEKYDGTHVTLSCPQPYASGHVLTPDEAEALNQLLKNKARRRINSVAQSPRAKVLNLQRETDLFVLNHTFDPTAKSPRFDPVASRAQQLAVNAVKIKIRENGGKINDYSPQEIRDFAASLINDELLQTAADQILQESAIAQSLLNSKSK